MYNKCKVVIPNKLTFLGIENDQEHSKCNNDSELLVTIINDKNEVVIPMCNSCYNIFRNMFPNEKHFVWKKHINAVYTRNNSETETISNLYNKR